MAIEWASATMVTSRLTAGGTPLTTAQIEDIIEQSEGYFKALLKISDDFTFSTAKEAHLLLRSAVVSRAALLVLAASSLSWATLESAQLAADILAYELEGNLKLLFARDVTDYLREL